MRTALHLSLAVAPARTVAAVFACPGAALSAPVRRELKEDGSLRAAPVLIGQGGVTEANADLALAHAENAIRAAELAAPSQLSPHLHQPSQKTQIVFDRRL